MNIEYCPYCGKKLEVDEKICSGCGQEIAFTHQGSINNDDYEVQYLEHEGRSIGNKLMYSSIGATLIIFIGLTLILMINWLPILFIMTTLAVEGMIINIYTLVRSIRFNKRLEERGYNKLAANTVTLFSALLGLGFGLVFFFNLIVGGLKGTPDISSQFKLLASLLALI